MGALLILKLTIVPLALLTLGVIERLHGPRLAGWLAGFPVIACPVLLFVAQEDGTAFAQAAALGAWFGLVPWLAFVLSYTALTRRFHWLACTVIGFGFWAVFAVVAVWLEDLSRWAAVIPLLAFVAAVMAFPHGEPSDEEREHVWWGLPARMAAGALLTWVILRFAGALGTHWSGVVTTFPVLGSIVCISNHLQYGRHAVREAAAGMTLGLITVGSFCFAVYVLLGLLGLWPAFACALLVSFTAHAATWLVFKKKH